MRLGIVLEQVLSPVPGGTGRYSAELAAALARTAESSDRVRSWVAWHRDVEPARAAGVSGPSRLPLPRRGLVAAWERGIGPGPSGADVLHAPTPLFPRRRQPLVVTIHDAVPWTHPETLTPRGVHWHKVMAERAARYADAIVVPTRAVAAELAGLLPARAAERLHPLGGGVARALLAEPAPELVERMAARLPGRYLFSLATLEPRKGLDVLMAALDRLGPVAPPLVVAGQPGWGGVEVDRPGVHVLGRIPDDELGVVLRRAAALVMPSRAEGFGLPVAEAMAVGTPVIASDIPALAEVAGDAAVLVPPGDPVALAGAIDELLGDETSLRKLADAGRARALDYDWDAVARRAWALYRTLR
ncbi:MAG TPA: glycosyltransferase family 1 protein [Jatrophihabitantaceae bacterium]